MPRRLTSWSPSKRGGTSGCLGGVRSLGATCGLLIIDEVHLLADERDALIKNVVARFHRWVESIQRQVRLMGLSATLPNYKEVALFLRVDKRRGLFFFGPEHYPVPLQRRRCLTTAPSRCCAARQRWRGGSTFLSAHRRHQGHGGIYARGGYHRRPLHPGHTADLWTRRHCFDSLPGSAACLWACAI